MTPLRKLDKAIQDFSSALGEAGDFVMSGNASDCVEKFICLRQTQRFNASPCCSQFRAGGLFKCTLFIVPIDSLAYADGIGADICALGPQLQFRIV